MILFTADLHLTDKAKDEYRFGIFKLLRDFQKDCWGTFILGDLTDLKDKHSSKLVNRIVDEVQKLRPPVYISMGNHDYVDHDSPFFGFLEHMEGVYFITHPQVIRGPDTSVLMFPHMPEGWGNLSAFPKGSIDYICIHQCVEGAISESGRRLSGLSPAPLEELGARRILAGDIHKPQDVGPVTYIGSPYSIRFGDDFQPRIIILEDEADEIHSIQVNDFPRKRSLRIRDISEIAGHCDPHDQVKITFQLPRESTVEWPMHKKEVLAECKRLELEVFGIELLVEKRRERVRLDDPIDKAIKALKSPEEVVTAFAKAEKLPKMTRDIGRKLATGEWK